MHSSQTSSEHRLHVPLHVLRREVRKKQTDKCAHSVSLVRSLLLPSTSRFSEHQF